MVASFAGDNDRVGDRVNQRLLAEQVVVIVGVGTVGSRVALELAKAKVGRLRLIDADTLKVENLSRFAFQTSDYLEMNKAEAMTLFLDDVVGPTQPEAVPIAIDNSLSDQEIDELLVVGDLIVAATGDPLSQRRIGARALALDIPTVFPALASGLDGEVFVQLGSSLPCFFCWQGFRQEDAGLHGVAALSLDQLLVIETAVHLTLGILDGDSEYANLLRNEPGQSQPQLFVWIDMQFARKSVPWRENCPVCRVGPSSLNQLSAPELMTTQAPLLSPVSAWVPQTLPPQLPPIQSPAPRQRVTRNETDVGGALLMLLIAAVATGIETFIFTLIIGGANQNNNPIASLLVPVFGIGFLVCLAWVIMALLNAVGEILEALEQ